MSENDPISSAPRTEPRKFSQKRPVLLKHGQQIMREKLHGKMFLVPSLVTVVAFFLGFLGIIHSINGNFERAVLCIAVSIIFDGLDGRVARRLNATSAFGREFDSISDVVAFGVAPAVLGYRWGCTSLADEFGVLVMFLYTVCGGARLARFNITTSDVPKKHFEGLPIPGAAIAVISLVYFHPQPLTEMWLVTGFVAYMALLAVMMVSTLPFFSVKHIRLTKRHTLRHLVVLSLVVALTWYHSRLALLMIATAYVMTGPFIYFQQRYRPQAAEPKQQERA